MRGHCIHNVSTWWWFRLTTFVCLKQGSQFSPTVVQKLLHLNAPREGRIRSGGRPAKGAWCVAAYFTLNHARCQTRPAKSKNKTGNKDRISKTQTMVDRIQNISAIIFYCVCQGGYVTAGACL